MAKGKWINVITRLLVPALVSTLTALAACVGAPPTPTPDIPATVDAAVAAAIPTATPTPVPDLEATVQAGIEATLAAMPTAIPTPTATPMPTPTPTATPLPTPTATPPPTSNPLPDTATMVESVRPSVVRIETDQGGGSGVIFQTTPQGGALVLTNHHVIEGAQYILVQGDSFAYGGTLQGFDAYRDLAVVQICCGRFQAVSFGDAGALKSGSEVVAMGYPLGFSGDATVTKGIVSAVRYDSRYKSWVVQTDAPINPGNSGGPLFTQTGKVVGINTYKFDYTESGRPTEGLGFAVSEATVQAILPELVQGNRVGLPTPVPTPTPQPQWRTYTNLPYQYQMRVPADWSIDTSDSSKVRFESPDESSLVAIYAYPDAQSISIADWVSRTLERESSPDVSSLFELREKSVEAHTGYIRYRAQYGSEHCVADYLTLFLLRGSWAFAIEGAICEHSLQEYRLIVDQMLASFEHR